MHVFGYMGAVRCIGYLSDPNGGEWKGIELDHPHPRGNDGFFDGVRYFTREQRHDMFARPSVVFHHKNAENVTAATNISLETIAFIQTNIQRCCPSNVNYFVTMLTRYWSLWQRSYFEPHSKSEAWQLSTMKKKCKMAYFLGLVCKKQTLINGSKRFVQVQHTFINIKRR